MMTSSGSGARLSTRIPRLVKAKVAPDPRPPKGNYEDSRQRESRTFGRESFRLREHSVRPAFCTIQPDHRRGAEPTEVAQRRRKRKGLRVLRSDVLTEPRPLVPRARGPGDESSGGELGRRSAGGEFKRMLLLRMNPLCGPLRPSLDELGTDGDSAVNGHSRIVRGAASSLAGLKGRAVVPEADAF
jgi:hypothetical protein